MIGHEEARERGLGPFRGLAIMLGVYAVAGLLIAAGIIVMTGARAHAAPLCDEGDSCGIVTRAEYDAARLAQCKRRVERKFDTAGEFVFQGTKYLTRRYPTDAGVFVEVVYQNYAGCWRLVEKSWPEDD